MTSRGIGTASKATWVGLLGVVLLSAAAALAGLLEVLFVPLRNGTVLVPVVIMFAVLGNIAFARLARWLVDTTAAAVAPFVCWLVVVLGLAMTPRAEGDVLISAGGREQWVFYGMLLGGAAAGIAAVVLTAEPRSSPARASGAGSSRYR